MRELIQEKSVLPDPAPGSGGASPPTPRRREIMPFISATSDFLCRADFHQVVSDERSPGAQGLGCQRSRHCLGISESFRSSSEGAQARSGHKNIEIVADAPSTMRPQT